MMASSLVSSRSRPVAIWLLAGVFMIMVQTLLGGITRLTGSGLSITEWDPIVGAIPPLDHAQWMTAFHKYQQTPQYHLQNAGLSLRDFKFIFFWEWFHRLWARSLGVVFIVPFIIFLIQRRFAGSMIRPMILLFLLGGLQGVIGWIMVESGLVGDNVRVSHLKLAAHFITAMLLLCYTFWFALRLLVREEQRYSSRPLRKLTAWIILVLVIQLVYGAFMAGLHAALAAHTWPDINGMIIPRSMFTQQPRMSNFINNLITVQFIHRGLAYLLIVLIFIWWRKAAKMKSGLLYKSRWLPLLIVLLQVVLGILTVVSSTIHIPVALAAAHQFTAMLLLLAMIWMLYLLPAREQAIA